MADLREGRSVIFERGPGFPRHEWPGRLFITALCVLAFRVGRAIPVLGLNLHELDRVMRFSSSSRIQTAFETVSICSLGILPYVSGRGVLIIIRFFSSRFQAWQSDVESGPARTRSFVVTTAMLLALIQAVGIGQYLMSSNGVVRYDVAPYFPVICAATFAAGTAFTVWLADRISQSGVGNGVAVMLLADMVPHTERSMIWTLMGHESDTGPLDYVILAVVSWIMIETAWRFEGARLRLPTNVTGEFVDLRIREFDERPLVFGRSLLALPVALEVFVPFLRPVAHAIQSSRLLWNVSFCLSTVVVAYLCAVATKQPEDIARRLAAKNETLVGVEPGEATIDFLRRKLVRLSVPNGIYLAALTIVPGVIGRMFNIDVFFGAGTIVFLLVGVVQGALENPELRLVAE